MDWLLIYGIFAERFGWTPDYISTLSWHQVVNYMEYIRRSVKGPEKKSLEDLKGEFGFGG